MNEEETIEVEASGIQFRIPKCCQEGWDDCPHAVHKEREKPKNIAV